MSLNCFDGKEVGMILIKCVTVLFEKRKRVLYLAIKYNYKFNHHIHSIKSIGASNVDPKNVIN